MFEVVPLQEVKDYDSSLHFLIPITIFFTTPLNSSSVNSVNKCLLQSVQRKNYSHYHTLQIAGNWRKNDKNSINKKNFHSTQKIFFEFFFIKINHQSLAFTRRLVKTSVFKTEWKSLDRPRNSLIHWIEQNQAQFSTYLNPYILGNFR